MRKIFFALFCGAFAAVAFGDTLYFAPTARGTADGSSAENAKAFTMEAVNKCAQGSVAQLCDGIYYFAGKNQFTVQQLTLQGNQNDRSAVVFDGQGAEAYLYVYKRPDYTVKDLTIRNAKASGSVLQFSDATTINCRVENCAFVACTNTSNYGGAIRLTTSGNSITNCYFENCYAKDGGAAVSLESAGLSISDCQFVNNSGKSALHVRNSASDGVSVERCVFVGNTATHGGAVQTDAAVKFVDCAFTNNSANLGAAVRMTAGGGELRGCKFVENQGLTSDGNNGGVVTHESTAPLVVVDCVFKGNKSSNSSGVFLRDTTSSPKPSLFVTNTTFEANECTKDGVVICASAPIKEIRLCGSTFSDNKTASGRYGGVIFAGKTMDFSAVDCTFSNNSAGNSGGAICYGGGTSQPTSGMIDLTGCTFSGCGATSASGGAVYIAAGSNRFLANDCVFENCSAAGGGAVSSASSFYCTNCVFSGNSSISSKHGGAISVSGANNAISAVGCIFVGNSGYNGGAIIKDTSSAAGDIEVLNCSFVSNVGNNAGGALFSYQNSGSIDVRNCLFVSNVVKTANGSSVIHATAGGVVSVQSSTFADNSSTKNDSKGRPIYTNSDSKANVTNCVFYKNTLANGTAMAPGNGVYGYCAADSGLTGEENGNVVLSASPFKDAENGDYSLAKKVAGVANPCLGAGVKLDWMTADSKDLAGNSRLRENDLVDLGCYEFVMKYGMRLIIR